MGFMEKVGAKIATKYGTVTRGKFTGCQIALGNPPKKPVETSTSFSQLIFVDGTEEKGRFDITKDIAGFGMLDHSEKAFLIIMMFANEETCEFNLEIRKQDSAMGGLVKGLLGQKTTANMTPQEALEQQYRGVKVFLWNTALYFVPRDLRFFREHFEQLGILDDLTRKVIDIALSRAPAEEE